MDIEKLKEEIKQTLPKRGQDIIIDGIRAKLVWIDNPWFHKESGRPADLLIRVSYEGEHGTWRRLSEIEEIIKDEPSTEIIRHTE